MREFYDNTMVSTHRQCPRKFFFRHEQHLKSTGTAEALAFGLGWHAAMDVVWQRLSEPKQMADFEIIKEAYEAFEKIWVEEGLPGVLELEQDQRDALGARTPDTCIHMIEEYIAARRSMIRGFTLLSIERPFAVPLLPDDDTIWYCGRIDKVYEDRGGVYFIDHKTTSAYKKEGGFRHSFTESFSPDSQMDGYAFAGKLLYGNRFKGIFVDGALVHKTVHDKFCYLPIIRGDESLEAWRWETLREIELIKRDREDMWVWDGNYPDASYLAAFPKHTKACWDFERICEYGEICKGVGNPLIAIREGRLPEPDRFVVEEWSPFDLNKIAELGIEK